MSTFLNSWRDSREERVERLGVVVREGPPARARQLGAAEDAVVREAVVDDEVAGAEEVADDADVGRVAADHDDARPRCRGSAASALLELAVERLLARGDAARRDRRAVALGGGCGGARDVGVAGEAEVVVRGEVQDLAAVDDGGVGGDPLVDVEVGDPDAHGLRHVELLAQLLVRRKFLDPIILDRHITVDVGAGVFVGVGVGGPTEATLGCVTTRSSARTPRSCSDQVPARRPGSRCRR